MKLGLTGKFFVAVFASCLLVMLGTLIAVRLHFHQGFLDYVRKSNENRVEYIANAMAKLYTSHGSWDFIRQNRAPTEYWYLLLVSMGLAGEQQAPQADDHGSKPPFLPPPGLRTHLWLTDEQHRVLSGLNTPPAEVFSRPILVNGHPVGWIVSTLPTSLTRAADVRFFDEQVRTAWNIAAMAAVVAAMMAVLLARGLLAPLKRLAASTHQLAAGNFVVRVPVTTHDEMGQLAEDFNRLAEALGSTEEMRRNFMADVSHELRTPLAVLRGELEALEDGVRALTPASLRSLQAEVATLSKLVDDLHQLSLADIGALTYRKHEVDLNELIELALGAFRERFAAQALAVSFTPQGGVPLFGDPDRLTQLLNNVLENCVRYTDRGGRVEIRCAITDGQIALDVLDSEPGVPEAELERLFERFMRLESSRNRSSGGAGLGLAICRSIVEAHGGTIRALASPLGGLCVAIRLPAAAV
ncbi:MAG: sensor histidine kinase efflux regulator BaeS [Burkholderiales bacterium]|nr:sensor histidine kinase efflux regulator BaeS [Burkholderiales bacterium]